LNGLKIPLFLSTTAVNTPMVDIPDVIDQFRCEVEIARRETEAKEAIVRLFEDRLEPIYMSGDKNY
jgi:hypothetical protein